MNKLLVLKFINRLRRKKHIIDIKKFAALKEFLSLFVLLLFVLGAAVFSVYRTVDSTFSNSYMNVPQTTSVDFKKSEPFTTLLIETGTNNSKNVCYAAVLASTNATTKQTTFMNFPVFALIPNLKPSLEYTIRIEMMAFFKWSKNYSTYPLIKLSKLM